MADHRFQIFLILVGNLRLHAHRVFGEHLPQRAHLRRDLANVDAAVAHPAVERQRDGGARQIEFRSFEERRGAIGLCLRLGDLRNAVDQRRHLGARILAQEPRPFRLPLQALLLHPRLHFAQPRLGGFKADLEILGIDPQQRLASAEGAAVAQRRRDVDDLASHLRAQGNAAHHRHDARRSHLPRRRGGHRADDVDRGLVRRQRPAAVLDRDDAWRAGEIDGDQHDDGNDDELADPPSRAAALRLRPGCAFVCHGLPRKVSQARRSIIPGLGNPFNRLQRAAWVGADAGRQAGESRPRIRASQAARKWSALVKRPPPVNNSDSSMAK